MRIHILLLAFASLVGCSSGFYVTPGPAADMAKLAPPDMRELLARGPAARFPAHLAVVRVQGEGYRSRTAKGWGLGGFTVVTARDVETEADFERIGNWPDVDGVACLNRLLLPAKLESELDLRLAAAQLKADLILLYTFDTQFEVDKRMRPASVITLGLAPTRRARVLTTASAVVIDTRTGFVYGTAETTARDDKLANAWSTAQAIDDVRRRTERKAWEAMIEDFELAWPRIRSRATAE